MRDGIFFVRGSDLRCIVNDNVCIFCGCYDDGCVLFVFIYFGRFWKIFCIYFCGCDFCFWFVVGWIYVGVVLVFVVFIVCWWEIIKFFCVIYYVDLRLGGWCFWWVCVGIVLLCFFVCYKLFFCYYCCRSCWYYDCCWCYCWKLCEDGVFFRDWRW